MVVVVVVGHGDDVVLNRQSAVAQQQEEHWCDGSLRDGLRIAQRNTLVGMAMM